MLYRYWVLEPLTTIGRYFCVSIWQMGKMRQRNSSSLVPGDRASKWWSQDSSLGSLAPESLHSHKAGCILGPTAVPFRFYHHHFYPDPHAWITSSDLPQGSLSNQKLCLDTRKARYMREVSLVRPQQRKTHVEPLGMSKEGNCVCHMGCGLLTMLSFWMLWLFQTLKILPMPQITYLGQKLATFTSRVATF